MNLDRLQERLAVAVSHDVELTSDQRKALEMLGVLSRASETLPALDEKISNATKQWQAAKERRMASATVVFPGVAQSPDDLVVIGPRRTEHGFRLLHRADGTLDFFGDQVATVAVPDTVYPNVTVQRTIADGEEFQGHAPRYYAFSPHRTIHWIPRVIWEALSDRHRERIDARRSAPRDLWKWSGGAEAFLPRERGRSIDGKVAQPSQEELTAATAKAISQCSDLVEGCGDVDLIRGWRANAGTAGDATPVLVGILDRRLAELGESVTAEPPEAA
jgi:hypothetical protein